MNLKKKEKKKLSHIYSSLQKKHPSCTMQSLIILLKINRAVQSCTLPEEGFSTLRFDDIILLLHFSDRKHVKEDNVLSLQ